MAKEKNENDSGLTPLYDTSGKRDKARRFIDALGNIFSRRKAETIIHGMSFEERRDKITDRLLRSRFSKEHIEAIQAREYQLGHVIGQRQVLENKALRKEVKQKTAETRREKQIEVRETRFENDLALYSEKTGVDSELLRTDRRFKQLNKILSESNDYSPRGEMHYALIELGYNRPQDADYDVGDTPGEGE